jgi:hypothetical protein
MYGESPLMLENLDPKIVVAGVALIAWAVRVEAKVLYMEKDLQDYKIREKEKDRVFWDKIESVQKSIGQVLESVIRMEEHIKYIQKTDK